MLHGSIDMHYQLSTGQQETTKTLSFYSVHVRDHQYYVYIAFEVGREHGTNG